MKRVLLSLMVMLILPATVYGAVSEDLTQYVRKDVYAVEMSGINSKLDMVLQKLDKQEAAINEISVRLSHLSGRVDGLDARVGDLRNDIYLWLVVLGIVIALPFVQRLLQTVTESRKPSLTLEDVKRLIEEAKLAGK